jgi:hypothetical protein
MKDLSFLVVMVEAFFAGGFSRGNPLANRQSLYIMFPVLSISDVASKAEGNDERFGHDVLSDSHDRNSRSVVLFENALCSNWGDCVLCVIKKEIKGMVA